MSKKYEILRPKEYSGRQIALPEEEFWELAKDLEDMKLEISTLEKENQELKEENSLYTLHLSDRKMTKWESKVWNLISNKYCSTMGQYSLVGLLVLIEKLDNKVKTQQEQFLKVVESVVKKYEIGKNEIHYVVGTQFKSSGNMVVAVIKEEYRKELLQEIKSAMEKEGE